MRHLVCIPRKGFVKQHVVNGNVELHRDTAQLNYVRTARDHPANAMGIEPGDESRASRFVEHSGGGEVEGNRQYRAAQTTSMQSLPCV